MRRTLGRAAGQSPWCFQRMCSPPRHPLLRRRWRSESSLPPPLPPMKVYLRRSHRDADDHDAYCRSRRGVRSAVGAGRWREIHPLGSTEVRKACRFRATPRAPSTDAVHSWCAHQGGEVGEDTSFCVPGTAVIVFSMHILPEILSHTSTRLCKNDLTKISSAHHQHHHHHPFSPVLDRFDFKVTVRFYEGICAHIYIYTSLLLTS